MMKRDFFHQFSILFIIVCLVFLQSWCLFVYFEDQRFLSLLMDDMASPTLSPEEQVIATMKFFRGLPVINNDHQYFLLPIFGFLRPTPRQVVETGGDCADRSRLLISLLHTRGISASKWALYSKNLSPDHAVVEVTTNKGKMVADPLFGLVFPDGKGAYHNINDLKNNSSILRDRIHHLKLTGENPGAVSIDSYPLDRYIYQYARTINWDKNTAMRILYQGLFWTMGNKANEVPRPFIVEQPALMIFWGITFVQGAFLILWMVGGKRRRTNTSI